MESPLIHPIGERGIPALGLWVYKDGWTYNS